MKIDIEKVIKLIMEKSEKTKKEILEEINEQMDKMGGFLSEEGAIMMIAQEHGIKFEKEDDKYEKRLLINELVPGMNSISVVGRIVALFPIKEFTRKDGSVGKVGSIMLQDRTGQIRLTLWDKQVEFFEYPEAEIGRLIEVTSANIKAGWKGGIDMSIGKKGQIKPNPDVDPNDYPEVKKEILKISQIKPNMNNVSTIGKVINDPTIKNITTKDGRETSLLEVYIADETGKIKIPIWENNIESVKNVKKGDVVLIENAYSKEGFNNTIDLNVGFSTNLKINPENQRSTSLKQLNLDDSLSVISKRQSVSLKIKDLTPQTRGVNTKFKCLEIGEIREVGSGLKVCEALVGDETGVIGFTVWNENIDSLIKGETYELENGYVNVFQNKMKLNQGKFGALKKSKEKITKINKTNRMSEKRFEMSSKGSRKRIHELNKDDFAEVRASILDIPIRKPFYEACPKCNKKVVFENSEYFCPKCNKIVIPVERVFFSILIDDGTGNLRVNIGEGVGERILGMSLDEMKAISEEEL
ncbi:MAG: DUF2240 family protein, partial [Candidatus Helarchaeota archaeon]